MAKLSTITANVRLHWWVRPYLTCLAFVATLTGREPCPEKVLRVLRRGVTITIVPTEVKPDGL